MGMDNKGFGGFSSLGIGGLEGHVLMFRVEGWSSVLFIRCPAKLSELRSGD